MKKGRLEAFSDGVIAIIITIMVLELKMPHGDSLASLKTLIPVFSGYVLSFLYIGIYWNSHHHLLQAVRKINGASLWANLHLLFWLSLIPAATSWMGENHFSKVPVICYGVILIMNGLAFYILGKVLLKLQGNDSLLARAYGDDIKGKISVVTYMVAIGLSFFDPRFGLALYLVVACVWFIPDKRIERTLKDEGEAL